MRTNAIRWALCGLTLFSSLAFVQAEQPELTQEQFQDVLDDWTLMEKQVEDLDMQERVEYFMQFLALTEESDLSDKEKQTTVARLSAALVFLAGEDFQTFVQLLIPRVPMQWVPTVTAATVIAMGTRAAETVDAMTEAVEGQDLLVDVIREAANDPVDVLGLNRAAGLRTLLVRLKPLPVPTQRGQSLPLVTIVIPDGGPPPAPRYPGQQ